jgi:hypothetical protein
MRIAGRVLSAMSCCALVVAGMTPLCGQGEDEEKPKGWLRMLPVGDAPPFRQVIRNGVREEIAAEPGTIPPPQVEVASAENRVGARLELGRVTAPVLAVAGPVGIFQAGGGGGNQPWQKITMPASPAALAFLWRPPGAESWDEARSFILPDDLQTFRSGQVRIVNVAPFPVAVGWRDETIGLLPGRHVLRGPGGGGALQDVPVAVSLKVDGQSWRQVFASSVSLNPGERCNIVIYRADGIEPRRPGKVMVLREKAVLPKLPK